MKNALSLPKRRWRIALSLLMLLGLAAVGALFFWYQTTKESLKSLPGVSDVVAPSAPRYTGSVLGDGQIARPFGVAVSPKGDRLYLSDSDGDRKVRIFNSSMQQVGEFYAPDGAPDSVPLFLAVAADGRVFMSDRRAHAVFIYSPDGQYIGTFQPQGVAPEDWSPMGLAFDSKGSLYVTDVTASKFRVSVFDPDGNLLTSFGTEGAELAQFWFPSGIAVDSQGRIYVADGNNGRLQVFDAQGTFLYLIPRGNAEGDLAMPRGVSIEGNTLYVVDTSFPGVKVYDVSGTGAKFLYAFGDMGVGNGQFRTPVGIALEGNKVYVADTANNRLQVWSY